MQGSRKFVLIFPSVVRISELIVQSAVIILETEFLLFHRSVKISPELQDHFHGFGVFSCNILLFGQNIKHPN